MSQTVSEAIAEALVRHGVEYVFGQSNPTALMLAVEEAGIRQLLYRTENAAGAMADAYSRVSNKIGVVAAQNGPAATLMVAPMAEALKVSIPMLVLVQEVPAKDRDKNAFQELDHFALFSGVAKWVRRLDVADRAAEYIDMAITQANSGRPGPVVLLLAKDMLSEISEPKFPARKLNLGSFPLDRSRPSGDQVERAAKLLAEADMPLIIAGGGVHLSQGVAELEEFVEISKVPIATTNMGKGVISEDGAFTLGVAGNLTGELGPATAHRDMISKADVVLFVGTRTNENGTDSWSLTSPDSKYIHIDTDPTEIGRNYESLRLLGDAKLALADLTEAMAKQDLSKREAAAPSLKKSIEEARRKRVEDVKVVCESTAIPILPQRLMGEIDKQIGVDDIVVADASYSSVWVTSFLTARVSGQRFLTPRGLAGLGWGLPFAIGAKLARPKGKIIGIVGDGGFGHVWGEIEMAVRENFPLVLIVLNNSELAMQKHGELLVYGKTTKGIKFSPVNHAEVARSAGAEGVQIVDPETFADALREALNSDKVTVLDVISSSNEMAPLRAAEGYAHLVVQ